MTNNNMYFIANWKMQGNTKLIDRVKSLKSLLKQKKYKKCKIIYCPPFTLIKTFNDKIKSSHIKLGAQNCNASYEYGPITGAINPKLIKSVGAKYVIVGHSESREQGDTNYDINQKIKSSLKTKLKVIFCIGEKYNDKKHKNTNKVLKNQIKKGLNKIKKFKDIIIAYEPVWSIGTGIIPNNFELKKTIVIIKKSLSKFTKGNKIRIIYGGSVNPKNVKNLAKIKELDGFLVGGASLNAKKFIDIIKKSIN